MTTVTLHLSGSKFLHFTKSPIELDLKLSVNPEAGVSFFEVLSIF